jgi:hypothetical protein
MEEHKIILTGAAPDKGAAPTKADAAVEARKAAFRKAADKVFTVHAGLLKRLAE